MTALMQQAPEIRRAAGLYDVPIRLIRRGANPRSDLGDLTELTASIAEHGVMQPILLSRDPAGALHLVAGERRLTASEAAGRTTILALIGGPMRAPDRLRAAVTENLLRLAMTPLDEARACASMLGYAYSHEQVARSFSRSAAWVHDRLALLELPDEVQQQVAAKTMPVTEAVGLARSIRRTGRGSVTIGSRCAPHFTDRHPLRASAKSACDSAGHPANGRTGGVCGGCWEAAIRADALSGDRAG